MRRRLFILWGLLVFMMMQCFWVMGYSTRDNPPVFGIVHQNDSSIVFAREHLDYNEYYFVELQQIQKNGNTQTLLRIWGPSDYDKVEIRSPKGKSVFLIEDTSIPIPTPQIGEDRWYTVDLNEWIQLPNPDSCQIRLHRPNGKYYTVTAKRLLACTRQLTGNMLPQDKAKEPKPYGPFYSIFYPNVSLEQVRNTFAYYLNGPSKIGNSKIYRKGNCHYLMSTKLPLIAFLLEGQSGHGLATFKEVAGGVWMDMDFWSIGYTQYGYYCSTLVDDEVKNIGMEAAAMTYRHLVPFADYGIALNGGYNKSNPTIDTVNLTKHPELAAVQHGDKVLAINGIDLKASKNYSVEYMLTYGNVPLSITLQRKDTPPYTVKVMPQMNASIHADVDVTAEVMKEERQHIKEEKLWEFWPQMPLPEVFDPMQSSDTHMDSPLTTPLLKGART